MTEATDTLRDMLRDELPGIVRQAVRAELAAQRSALSPRHRRVVLALHAVFGDAEFSSEEALEEMHRSALSGTEVRRELRAALVALCRGDVPDAQRIGQGLRGIARADGTTENGLRLVDAGKKNNTKRWAIEGATSR